MESEQPDFVVAIAASAGGLEAITNLLSHMERDFLGAIVIAQHLSPSHRSQFTPLVSKTSKLRVLEIEGEPELERGTVYVAPENCDVVFQDRKVSLLPRPKDSGPHPSANRLFSSMAKTWGERSIAVILSGTGSDGALGAVEVDDAKGRVIAQDEDTAKYWSMPKAAIDKGVVGLIQPCELLAKYLQTGPTVAPDLSNLEGPEQQDLLHKIAALVSSNANIDILSYKSPTLIRRLSAQMAATDSSTIEKYYQLLASHPDEIRNLTDALLIPVTEFFRDPEEFQAVQEHLREGLLACIAEERTFRMWVAGCCTGEEVYSLAISIEQILSSLEGSCDYQIFATDLSERSIQTARKGVYSFARLNNLDEDAIAEFFEAKDLRYKIINRIRDKIVFSRHDIIRSTPFPRTDFVVCRNLLIYFTAKAQNIALSSLAISLNPGGYLFLGKAETVTEQREAFKATKNSAHIFQRNQRVVQPPRPWSSLPSRDELYLSDSRTTSGPKKTDQELLEEQLLENTPPAVLISENDHVLNIAGNGKDLFSMNSGPFPRDVFSILPRDIVPEIRACVIETRRNRTETASKFTPIAAGSDRLVRVRAKPESESSQRLLLIFEFSSAQATTIQSSELTSDIERANNFFAEELNEARKQLNYVVEQHEVASEELQASNEELASSNEELQATNEELETTNEELQATNEELETVNDELNARNREVSGLNLELTSILESLESPVFILDEGSRVSRLNLAARHLISEVKGIPQTSQFETDKPLDSYEVMTDLGHPELAHQFRTSNDRLFNPVKILNDWFQPRVSNYSDQSSTQLVVLQLNPMTEILTAKQRLEQEKRKLEEKEAIQALLLDHIPANIALLNQDGVILEVNERWREFARSNGYMGDSFYVGENYLEVCGDASGLDSEESTLAYDALEKVLSKKEDNVFFEYPCHSMTEKRWFECRVQGVDTLARRLAVVSHMNITDRYQAERLFQNTFESRSIGNIVVDSQGWIQVFSQGAKEIFGHSPTKIQQQQITTLFGTEQVSRVEKFLKTVTSNQELPKVPIETIGKRKSGQEFPMSVHISRLTVGESPLAILSITDVTELKNLEKELEHRRRLEIIGQLAGGVAHDFNNLMTVIVASLEKLSSDELNDSAKSAISTAIGSIERGAGLTKQLLSFARQQVLLPDIENLGDLIDENVNLLNRTLESNITLQVEKDISDAYAEIDKGMFASALLNLVLNARDAIPLTGSITIHLSRELVQNIPESIRDELPGEPATDELILVQVQDTGTGIPQDLLDRVVEPFFTTKDSGNGSGLGLSSVHGFCHQSNGTLVIDSAENNGTTVTMVFPMAQKRPVKPTGSRVKSVIKENMSILVVEDNQEIAKLLSDQLQTIKAEPKVVPNASDALELLRAQPTPPDMIITDVMMPNGPSGIDFAEFVRDTNPDVPILIVSGYSPDPALADRIKAIDADFLHKPYRLDDLISAIGQLLSNQSSRQVH